MLFKDIEVTYQDVSASEEVQDRILGLMTVLYDQTPYDSQLRLKIQSHAGQVMATLILHTTAGRFAGRTTGPEVERAVRSLTRKMRSRIEFWKAHRFDDEHDHHDETAEFHYEHTPTSLE